MWVVKIKPFNLRISYFGSRQAVRGSASAASRPSAGDLVTAQKDANLNSLFVQRTHEYVCYLKIRLSFIRFRAPALDNTAFCFEFTL